MSEIPIVFARGQNEGVDPRVLPIDQHKSVQNVRFRKDGRPQKRPALTSLSLSGLFTAAAYVNLIGEVGGTRLIGTHGQLAAYLGSPGWKNITSDLPLSTYSPGERIPVLRTEVANQLPVLGASVTYTSAGKLVYAWQAGGGISYISSTTGGALGSSRTIVSAARPRLMTVNGNTYAFVLSGTTLTVRLYSTATESFGSPTTLQTVTGGGSYDVCAHGSAEFVIIWQNSLTQLSLARYSAVSTPTIVGSAVNVTTNSSAQFPAVACTATSAIFFAWLEQTATPSFRFGAYDTTLTTLTGAATTVLSAAGIFDQPGVAIVSNTAAEIFCGQYTAPTCFLLGASVTSAAVVGASYSLPNARLSSKPFVGPDPANFAVTTHIWTHSPEGPAWEDQRNMTLQRTSGGSTPAYLLRQTLVPNCFGSEVYSGGVPLGNTHLADVVDTGVGVWTVQRTQLRQAASPSSAQLFGLDAISIHSIQESQLYAARDTTLAGRALQISGGALIEHTGGSPALTGFGTQPVIVSSTTLGGGSLSVGTYLYRAVFESLDSAARRVRSATSDPVSVTTVGANLTAVLTISPALGELGLSTNIVIHVYRSLVGQSTYHRVTPNTGAPITSGTESANITYTDTMSDAIASANEFIYTDGGVLDNTTPPASTFMCTCNGRVWLGGQFDRTVITASKLLVDGEPTQFSAFAAFNVTLPRKCTGLASIDGVVVAFASDGIYLINGTGPDNQGVGAFNPPLALPTDDGCVDWRSIVETAEGVFFLARRGIMLLPRGFNAAQFIGAPVESTLLANPFITSATLVAPSNGDETTVRFTCNDGGGVNPGATLIYNTRTGGWIVDVMQLGSAVSGPGGTWLGRFVQTVTSGSNVQVYEELSPASYGEGGTAFIPSILATGDLRPFGVAGYGNFESVTVMGEYRGAANVVVSVSVDGVTPDTYTFAVTAGDAADGVVYLDVTPKIRKGCSISVTIQDAAIGGVATEGFIAQAVYLEVEAMTGNKRLPAARRA